MRVFGTAFVLLKSALGAMNGAHKIVFFKIVKFRFADELSAQRVRNGEQEFGNFYPQSKN